MRFVSRYPKLGIGTVIPEEFALTGYTNSAQGVVTGKYYQTQKSVFVQFTQEYLTQADVDAALAHWKPGVFSGMNVEGDGVTPYPPLTERIGVFDTEEEQIRRNWSDEVRGIVETYMMRNMSYGVDFIKVEKAVAAKPWPSYDSTHHSKIAALAAELGLVSEAIAYERENKNRQSVIAALEAEAAKAQPATVDGELIVA